MLYHHFGDGRFVLRLDAGDDLIASLAELARLKHGIDQLEDQPEESPVPATSATHALRQVSGEIIATPGCESNVKEIFDKCNELAASGEDLVIFNQFDEFGNYLWHWSVTGAAVEDWMTNHSGPAPSTGSVSQRLEERVIRRPGPSRPRTTV